MSEFKVGDIVYIKGFNECGAIKVVHENFIDKIVRYEVKTNNNEYTLLGTMLEHIDNHSQNTQQLEQRIEKLEKCVMGEQNKCEKCANVSSMSKNGLLTEDEIVILRNLDKRFEWIARDENGDLYVYEEKPEIEKDDIGCCFWLHSKGYYYSLYAFEHMFKFVTFHDGAYNIEELLKGECGNE
jgi:hypothetical protein